MENNSSQQDPLVHREENADMEKHAKEERMWAMFCHLAGLAGYVIAVPFAGVVGPLIIWSLKKEDYTQVREQGKEAMNFQISVAIYFLALLPLALVLVGIPLLIALGMFQIICVIIAAVKASEGESYKYPLSIRLIK